VPNGRGEWLRTFEMDEYVKRYGCLYVDIACLTFTAVLGIKIQKSLLKNHIKIGFISKETVAIQIII
jgi:hypothetical protein